jgi:hypothetical protein
MKRQLRIFGALFLSMVAGMAASEVLSRQFDPTALDAPEVSSQTTTPAEVAGVTLPGEVVN